jgi:hypothetical protein
MALALYDRVQQTGSANTTVSFTLTGSVTGYQSFAVVGNGNTTYYAATDSSGDWEVGIGTYSTTGPTLTRTTIISSSNSGSAVTFSGTVNVFVTYPAEDSVYLNGGNVSALGTVSSGTWQGTTVGVAYGGTGVTSSSGANSVVLRDADGNIAVNNIYTGFASTVSSGTTVVLTAASANYQLFTGTTAQTVQLPVATTLQVGESFAIDNDTTQTLTIVDSTGVTVIDTIPAGGIDQTILLTNGTSAGTWSIYSQVPSAFDFGTNTASFNNVPITNAVWNGTAVGATYGGTGLSGFGAANYALYSTSTTALTAGTLPIAAGGTNATSFNAPSGSVNPLVWFNGSALTTDSTVTDAGYNAATNTLYSNNFYVGGTVSLAGSTGTSGQVFTSNGSSAPTWSTPSGVSKAQAIAYSMTLGF